MWASMGGPLARWIVLVVEQPISAAAAPQTVTILTGFTLTSLGTGGVDRAVLGAESRAWTFSPDGKVTL